MAKSKPPTQAPKALVCDDATKVQLAQLGAVHCSIAEVAEHLGATESELADFLADSEPCREVFEKAAANARMQLRAAQFKLAEKSPTMAIFLGRQYLGQGERRELDVSVRAAETAADAEFVRHALAALAADRDPPGDPEGADGGQRRDAAGDPL